MTNDQIVEVIELALSGLAGIAELLKASGALDPAHPAAAQIASATQKFQDAKSSSSNLP